MKPKRVSAQRLVTAYGELLKTEPLETFLVRVDDNGEECEVDSEEVLRRPGVYRLVSTKEQEEGHHKVIAESEPPAAKAGTELTRDQALARDIQRSGDRWALQSAQSHEERKWYHERFKSDQDTIASIRGELAERDHQIAQLMIQLDDSGTELVELVKEGMLIFKNYHFSKELKLRLNKVAPGLKPEQLLQIAKVVNSPEFQEALESSTEPEPAKEH